MPKNMPHMRDILWPLHISIGISFEMHLQEAKLMILNGVSERALPP
jgi:hypothetical protein